MPKIKNNRTITLSILNLLYSLLTVSFAAFSKLIVDSAQNKNTEDVILYSVIFIIIIIFTVCLKFFENMLYVKFMIKLEHELKEILFDNILSSKYDKTHNSLVLQTYTSDVSNIVSGKLDTMPRILSEIGRLIFACILLAIIEYKVLIVLVCLCLIGPLVLKIYINYMKNLNSKVLEVDGRLNSFFQESTKNTTLIQAYDAKDNFIRHYKQIERDSKKTKTKKFNLQVGANNILVLGSNLILCLVVFYGGYNIAIGVMTYGSLMAIMQLFSHISSPVINISGYLNRYSLYKASMNRFGERLNSEIAEIKDIKDFEKIEFSDASFKYKDKPLFENLSFEIKKGVVCQIKGESGIGKSTLFQILLGNLTLTKGEVNIYCNNEKTPLNKTNLFGYVSQESILFSGSIRDNFNLLVGNCDKMEEALIFSNLYDEVVAMEKGFDTILLESGKGLSIGQLQRLLIALSYSLDREVFLLDEFTSSLDKKNCEVIINNLKKLNKTVIYISHKNENIKNDLEIDLTNYKPSFE